MTVAVPPSLAHTPLEDAIALVQGTLFVAFGVLILKQADLATGGTAGIAFLLHYGTGLPLGALFFAVNLPFYAFAWRVFGSAYTLKTFAAVTLLSVEASVMPSLVSFNAVHPLFAAVAGGLMSGMGLLILIRHRCSLGGLGVLVVFLQDRYGWRAGKVQMAADALITAAAFLVLPPAGVALSVVGAVFLNLVIALNHKPGRYAGF